MDLKSQTVRVLISNHSANILEQFSLAYSEPYQTSKMGFFFAKIVTIAHCKPMTF